MAQTIVADPHVGRESGTQSRLAGAHAWWVWILSVAFVVFLFSVQTGYAIVSGNVQKDVGLTVTQVATIAATYTWVFALFQFYGGALLDQLGSRKVLPISIALVVLGVFVFANAKTFEMLLLSQAILAIGSCTGFVGAGYIGGQWFGMAKFSFMFGLVQVVAALTSAVSQNGIELALRQTDWRSLFNYVGVAGVVLFVLGAVFIKNPAPVVNKSTGGVFGFLATVTRSLADVAKIGHVWMASIIGALLFGVLLALGVVWAPKLLMVRGASESAAALGASMLWLGLAFGSAIVPWWSDRIRARKRPIVYGCVVQALALALLVYFPLGAGADLVLCFILGFANAAHMLAFSTAADVVEPRQIGTSAAIVNGTMFLVSGLLIARPGQLAERFAAQAAAAPELAQRAALPLELALVAALILAVLIKESHPRARGNKAAM